MKLNIFLFSFLFFLQLTFSQTNYYVSTEGTNENDGSENAPFKTIQFAVNKLEPGDTLNILKGIYYEKIALKKSGTPQKRIIIRGIDFPVLDGSKKLAESPIITIKSVSDITLTGLEIANNIQNEAQGILVKGVVKNLTIKNCKIHDIHFSEKVKKRANKKLSAFGILVQGTNVIEAISNIKITDNELFDCRLSYGKGILLNGNVDGFTVKNNKIHGITNAGIAIFGNKEVSSDAEKDQARNGTITTNEVFNCTARHKTIAGIYVDGGRNTKILNNKTYNNGYGIEVVCETTNKTTSNIEVGNNVVYNNNVAGLVVGSSDYPKTGKVTDSKFYKNILFNNTNAKKVFSELYISYLEDSLFYNNVLYSLSGDLLSISSLAEDLRFRRNMYFAEQNSPLFYWGGKYYYNLNNFIAASELDKDAVYANPLFVSAMPNNFNYQLQQNSPALELLKKEN